MIVRDANQTVFVEVKARRTLADAAYSVSPRQSIRLAIAAQAWLEREGRQNDDIRFDVVLVDRNGNSEILENALTFDN
jgi:putative endonuclease